MPPKQVFVNTDSTAGGNGTTNATTGANRAYATLKAALDAEARDCTTITGAAQGVDFICDGVADDVIAPSLLSTWKCEAANFITVKAANNHGGKWNTAVYRLAATITAANWWSAGDGGSVHIIEFQGIQFTGTPSNTASARHLIEWPAASVTAGTTFRFHRCIFRQINNPSYTGNTCRCFRVSDSDLTLYFNSCLFYDWQGSALSCASNNNTRCYNCTFIGTTSAAIAVTSANIIARNCIFYGCNSVSTVTINALSNYNSTDLTTVPTNFGANSRVTQTFSFVDPTTTRDYHLLSTDGAAKGFGETYTVGSPGGVFALEDIDNQVRTAPWDIGADQYVPPAGGVSRTDITIRIYA